MTVLVALTLQAALGGAPRRASANAAGVMYLQLDDEGESRQVVPRAAGDVRMVAERVVLVPYYDAAAKRANVLVSGRYDLLSERSHGGFPVGYPEVKGAYTHHVESNVLDVVRKLELGQPTIRRLSAWADGRRLAVREHPGVARYRRWFTFEVPLEARRRVPLRVRYVSRVGRSLRLWLTDAIGFRHPGLYTWADYWIDYVLHTGSTWSGPIGQGEVALFAEGRLHTLKRFTNLRPTPKDDLTVRLEIGRIPVPKAGAEEETDHVRVLQWKRLGKDDELDLLALVQGSSELPGPEVESLAALAVDGDPTSAWVSAAGKGVGAWLQLPADPGRKLESLQVRSVARNGVSRPARIEVRCLSRHRTTVRRKLLSTTSLPNADGPHRLPTPGAAGCAALLLTVVAVHGSAALPVGIAEVEQRYATPPKGAPRGVKLLPCCYARKPAKICRRPVEGMGGGCLDPVEMLYPALQTARPAIAKIPAAELAFGYEIARISDVRWSPDGTVAHYRLWLENEHRDPRAVLMGHFVEVATLRVLGRYRLDQAGTLPEPERSQWKEAMPFEAGERLLREHRFVAAIARRAPPPGPALSGTGARVMTSLDLRSALPPLVGRLKVTPRKSGFAWRYEPNMYSRPQARAPGTLELLATARGGKPGSLLVRRPELDHEFAVRHQKARERRRGIIAKTIGDIDPKANVGVLLAGLFPRVHAFSGQATLYWHPSGRAVLAAWQEVKDLSSLLPDSLVEVKADWGGERFLPPRSFDRLDYARVRAQATVHALVPTLRTTLRLAP